MREIKFRAWLIPDKEMVEVLAIAFDEALIHFETKDNKTDWWSKVHFELMQFTGLRDRNKKEIYEGDILKWKFKPELVYICKYDVGGFYIEANIDPFKHNDKKIDELFITTNELDNCEIIGNTYENPELLKQDK